jgi:hypothetical protein
MGKFQWESFNGKVSMGKFQWESEEMEMEIQKTQGEVFKILRDCDEVLIISL